MVVDCCRDKLQGDCKCHGLSSHSEPSAHNVSHKARGQSLVDEDPSDGVFSNLYVTELSSNPKILLDHNGTLFRLSSEGWLKQKEI